MATFVIYCTDNGCEDHMPNSHLVAVNTVYTAAVQRAKAHAEMHGHSHKTDKGNECTHHVRTVVRERKEGFDFEGYD